MSTAAGAPVRLSGRAGRNSLTPVRRRTAWLDWLAGTDPGFNRLLLALQVVVAIGLALAAEWAFVHATSALMRPVPSGLPAAQAAGLAAVNHAVLVIAMMLGAIVAMLGSFVASMEANPRRQLETFLLMPVPMVATLCVGLSLHTRVGSLASLAIALAVGTYCRRFGPRGFVGGMLLFMGAFLGYFLQELVTVSAIGWLAAEIGVGVLVTIAVHFALFRPRPQAAVDRMQRSFAARARDVAGYALDVFDEPERPDRLQRRLRRQLLRLNEAALIVDAHLARPGVMPSDHAAGLHQCLFDAELALANIARFATALRTRRLPEPLHRPVHEALLGIGRQDLAAAAHEADRLRAALAEWAVSPDVPLATGADGRGLDGRGPDGRGPGGRETAHNTHILAHRFATSVSDYSTAMSAWLATTSRGSAATVLPRGSATADRSRHAEKSGAAEQSGPAEQFESPVMLFGGWLPGSAMVSAAASAESGGGWVDRVRLAPYARVAIQMGVAVGAAIVVGDVVSGRRFYWAVIAAFVTFMGANTAGEQLRKASFRVFGTFIGVLAGSAIEHVIGDRVGWQIAVVLVSLLLGLYLMRINYTFMVIAITIMVAQLYEQLEEFSNTLLLLRLEETAIGAAVAMLTVVLVLPLRTSRVARVAARQYIVAVAALTDLAFDRLLEAEAAAGTDARLRAGVRGVDVAYQALVATVWPLRTPLFGQLAERIAGFMHTATALGNYSRNLVVDLGDLRDGPGGAGAAGGAGGAARTSGSDGRDRPGLPAGPARAGVANARAQLADSFAAIVEALETGDTSGGFVRSASLVADAAAALPAPSTSPMQLVLRDLQLIDGSAAEAAKWAGLAVADLDTSSRDAVEASPVM